MDKEKYNSEGYYDPTCYEALSNIAKEEGTRKFRPFVYICSPYSGNIELNTLNARRYSRFALDKGMIPIAPHLLFPQSMDDTDEDERDLALFMDLAILSKCAELWVFGGHISHGMSVEIQKAQNRNQTIRYFTASCEEVIR